MQHRTPDRIPQPIDDEYVASLHRLAAQCGLDRIGVAPAVVMERARATLIERKRIGLNDTMQFTYRNPQRSTEPDAAVAGARSMIVAARSYVLESPPEPQAPYASVARYAWVDHYEPLRFGLQNLVRKLRDDGYKAVAFADDNSVVDREAAWLAGLGWFGKNANVLLPGSGSFFVLGSVITTAPLPTAVAPVADGCGTCQRCIDGCPTAAIVAPGVVDAGRCLAWLLQRPGVFPREFRVALGDRIYGCDECQTVCPPTMRFERRSETNQNDHAQAYVSLVDLLRADDETILADFGRWYLAERNPMWLRRNALIALGNAVTHRSDERVIAVVRDYLGHAEPMLRAHAVWAAAQLGLHHMLPDSDPDPLVADEIIQAVAELSR
ncbi:MAG: tRNA epoxyqueuosine(34) reductase QueG [Ilumatobacteraceae bacterium]